MTRLIQIASIIKKILRHRLDYGKSDVNIISSLLHLIYFRLTWKRRDLDYMPWESVPYKFMSARMAAALIGDNACVVSTGMASNGRCSIFYWAIRDRFHNTGHPANLTWISVSGQGGRGMAPGTIEEMALPGLISRHIGGHLETHKSLLKLADQGKLDLHTICQGVLSSLIDVQAGKELGLTTSVGIGTFLDPRVGNGSRVLPNSSESLVKRKGDFLEYSLPPIDTAVICAPYADSEGNIYFKNASLITENLEAARAAKANGGIVLVTVSRIIEKNEADISIPTSLVDAIVVNPRNEQTGGVLQRRYSPIFTEGARVDVKSAFNLVEFANTFLGITPMRDESDALMARYAVDILIEETRPGSLINIGIGLPEEVSRYLFESERYKEYVFSTEAGAYGGFPVAGLYFGAAINPVRLISSAETFRLYEKQLATTVLGMIEADSMGNVNVSRRGASACDYVGPGGFTDIVTYAKTIIFIGKWMQGAEYEYRDGKLSVTKTGKPKFVDQVREITFNGQGALAAGKNVYYVTNIGVFRLRPEGLVLVRVTPGIDIEKDVLRNSLARIVVPDPEAEEVPAMVSDIPDNTLDEVVSKVAAGR